MKKPGKHCDEKTLYPSHESETARLNRIAGQIEGVKKMVAERRYCADILTQLRAVRSAIKAVEANILETYLGSCVMQSFRSGDAKDKEAKIDELKELFKRFE